MISEHNMVSVIGLAGLLSGAVLVQSQSEPPLIITQPQSQSVSLDAKVIFRVQTTGGTPMAYQWQCNGLDRAAATNATLVVTNAKTTDAGRYTVTLSNAQGSVTSWAAVLDVDPSFTKITTGAIVSDSGSSWACAWGDYDNDGFIDLFVANAAVGVDNYLYHNLGDGTFKRITDSSVVANPGVARGCVWGDLNNDGYLDLFVMNFSGNNGLYRNNGNGTFTALTDTAPALDLGEHSSCAWGDYDNDGDLDLFVGAHLEKNLLYRNNGGGVFTQILSDDPVNDVGHNIGCGWADYDNDGRLDLLVGNHRMPVFLYHNDGRGTFNRVIAGAFVNGTNDPHGVAWGDYDNDGFLDVFFASESGADVLYHNHGDGTFTRVSTNQIATLTAHSYACAWGDYDNDGFLDLFVVKAGGKNLLYHNNGDGTFTQVTRGSLANDNGYSYACAWGDYDNDGFLDLFVGNWARNNFLYHNNGNRNHWLNLRCVGTASNRAAIGAKIRVQATIRGAVQWQLRVISGGRSGSQDDLRAAFGLGDATVADTVRIEWPSGITQELHGVKAQQFLTVTEPSQLTLSPAGTDRCRVELLGSKGRRYAIEESSDLLNWKAAITLTNQTRRTAWTNPVSDSPGWHFYRAVDSP